MRQKSGMGIGGAIGLLVLVLLLVFLMPLVLMWCWNFIMPAVFNLPMITYWQAFVMGILADVLFKNISYKQNKE